jgi:L-gulono-1,4-lactone dehydrogenase
MLRTALFYLTFGRYDSSGLCRGSFCNWEGRWKCTPGVVLYPSNLSQCEEAIALAVSKGCHLRVVGAGHSWSNIALVDSHDIMVSLDKMNKVLHVDGSNLEVTVEAGIRLHELSTELDKLGLAIPILGSVSQQSIAGAISTGTHGSSPFYSTLCSLVQGLVILTAAGERRVVSSSDPSFGAYLLTLGTLGMIVEVTLRVTPAFNLQTQERIVPLEMAYKLIEDPESQGEFSKVWVMPHTNKAIAFSYSKVTSQPTWHSHKWVSFVRETLVEGAVAGILWWFAAWFPFLTPLINNIIVLSAHLHAPRIGRSDSVFNLDVPLRHPEMEYALPKSCALQAIQEMLQCIDRKHRVNFIIEIRYVAADAAWLSPAYQQPSVYVGFLLYRQEKMFSHYFNDMEVICQKYGGRPHWGKLFFAGPEEVCASYPRWNEFVRLRKDLDTAGTFLNAFTEQYVT